MKDKLIGLAVLALIILGFIIFSGGSSDDTKEDTKKEPDAALVKKQETQLKELNKWFKNYNADEDSGITDEIVYKSAVNGYSHNGSSLTAVMSKKVLESTDLTEKEVAKYAFAVLQEYPGELSAFDNIDEDKVIINERLAKDPVMYTTLD